MTNAISVNSVSMDYWGFTRTIHALKDVNLVVPEGSVFGLLGPNGAGKTTLLKLLLGLMRPKRGSLSVFRRSVLYADGRKDFGYLPENHKFPTYMTGNEVLHVYAGMSGMPKSERDKKIPMWIDKVGLSKADAKMVVRKYSKGMQQRLGLAQALIHDPRVIFLDEPTDGVDPKGRYEIRMILEEEKRRGKTIFINSHLLSEVELICDRVAILKQGRVEWEGTMPEIQSQHHVYFFGIPDEHREKAISMFAEAFPSAVVADNGVNVELPEADNVTIAIDMLRSVEIPIYEIRPLKRSLEEFFIEVVNNGGAA